MEVNGALGNIDEAAINWGGMLGFEEVNSSQTILPTFGLTFLPLYTGLYLYYPPASEPAFEQMVPYLGVAIYGGLASEMAYGIIALELKYGVVKPKIFPQALHSGLINAETTRNFKTASISTSFYVISLVRFF
jgi:hypothetical protein